MVPVPPSCTTVKIPVVRVVRVLVSSALTPPPPCTPCRLSLPCCWTSRTTLTCLEDWALMDSRPISTKPSVRASVSGGAIHEASISRALNRMALARDVRFLGQLVPYRLPVGHVQAEFLTESLDLGGESLAD